jgi:molecular chaperone HscB
MLKVVHPAVPVACWSCSVAHNESTLFCPHCSKIQPPPGADFFSVFGLAPRLNLDLSSLEKEFHRLSRRLHPDRFARAAANEREWSLADTALLNDAYRTLKDPITRTEYLLKLHGAEIGEEFAAANGRNGRDGKMGASRVPADLLEEVFDLNMQLEEMRMAHKMGEDEDPALKQDLTAARKKFEGLREAVDHDLKVQWAAWDNGDEPCRHGAEAAMIALLDRRRYLSNLVRDVSDTLEGKDSGGVFTQRGR